MDSIFFVWTHSKNSLKNFMMEFGNSNPHIDFTYEFNEKNISLLDLMSNFLIVNFKPLCT